MELKMSYINTTTKQYPVSEQDIRNQYPNTSFPVPFQAPEEFAVVFLAPTPTVENPILQTTREIAPVLTDKGHYEQAYEIVDIYSDYTDADGKVITKAEQEAAAIAKDEQTKKDANKARATQLLKETDWVEVPSVSDTTKTPHLTNFSEFMDYRMELRAIAVNPPVIV
jgi:hypothetical protein